jgi:excisionase family DNA binding protein
MTQTLRDPSNGCLTSGDIARSLNVDLKTVHRWVRRGRLRGQRTKGGHLRFRRVEVVRFLRLRHAAIPAEIRVAQPRVLVVGAPPAVKPGAVKVCLNGLFDALLELATATYDVVAVQVDGVDVEQARDFVLALRRHARTQQLALIGVSRWTDRRHAVIAAGADLAVSSDRELVAAVSFITGTPVDLADALTSADALPPGAAVHAIAERDSLPSADGDSRALAG